MKNFKRTREYVEARLRHVEPEAYDYICELENYLRTLIPMAKGFALNSDVGNNRQMVSDAEKFLGDND